jgi:hypothetical protein
MAASCCRGNLGPAALPPGLSGKVFVKQVGKAIVRRSDASRSYEVPVAHSFSDTRVRDAQNPRGAVCLTLIVVIRRPREGRFRFYRDLKNLPRFLGDVMPSSGLIR